MEIFSNMKTNTLPVTGEKIILAPFTFSLFRMTLEAVETLHLPSYKGSAIRGSFGHTFKKVACSQREMECKECDISQKCVYAYIFETIANKNDSFLRNSGSVAHPYIIRPPLDAREVYGAGEELVFELILVGKAIDYMPYFAYTFVQMGEQGLGRGRGKFILKEIESVGLHGRHAAIYRLGDQNIKDETLPITCEELLKSRSIPEECTLRFLTRLELKEKGGYPEPDFGLLFRGLLRRITTLGHLHCGLDCTSIDFSGLSHAADEVQTVSNRLDWEDAERFSNRQKQRMPFGGMKGEIAFRGDLTPFWPYILLGEWVHLGKKTSFGLGRYVVD
jgi:hypothetical protein